MLKASRTTSGYDNYACHFDLDRNAIAAAAEARAVRAILATMPMMAAIPSPAHLGVWLLN